ncbi:MAG: hypothetical protein Q9201_000513 [Fulgogasparrea decipioides]
MNSFNAYPPIRHHSSQRISTHRAQQLLAQYLEDTITDASLHPNALLTENGPVNPASGSTGLVLHNLKRVEAGLRGEHLSADLTFKNFGGEGLPDLLTNGVSNRPREGEESQNRTGQNFEEDWQDKDEYEREQAIVQGELEERNNALEDRSHGGHLGNEYGDIPDVKHTGLKAENNARKLKKKQRRKQERKDREAEM